MSELEIFLDRLLAEADERSNAPRPPPLVTDESNLLGLHVHLSDFKICGSTRCSFSDDGKYCGFYLEPSNEFVVCNVFNGERMHFKLEERLMSYVWKFLFIDLRHFLVASHQSGNTRILMFELDQKTKTAQLKHYYFDEIFRLGYANHFWRRGSTLFMGIGYQNDNDGMCKITFYSLCIDEPKIEKYHTIQFRPLINFYCPGFFENKLLTFNEYGPMDVGNLKTLYCVDLNDGQLTKFDLKLPDTMIAMEEEAAWETWTYRGVWKERDFYCSFTSNEYLLHFIGHFNWFTKQWNPIPLLCKFIYPLIGYPHIDSNGILTIVGLGRNLSDGLCNSRFPIQRPESLLKLTSFAVNRLAKHHYLPSSLKQSIAMF